MNKKALHEGNSEGRDKDGRRKEGRQDLFPHERLDVTGKYSNSAPIYDAFN